MSMSQNNNFAYHV